MAFWTCFQHFLSVYNDLSDRKNVHQQTSQACHRIPSFPYQKKEIKIKTNGQTREFPLTRKVKIRHFLYRCSLSRKKKSNIFCSFSYYTGMKRRTDVTQLFYEPWSDLNDNTVNMGGRELEAKRLVILLPRKVIISFVNINYKRTLA